MLIALFWVSFVSNKDDDNRNKLVNVASRARASELLCGLSRYLTILCLDEHWFEFWGELVTLFDITLIFFLSQAPTVHSVGTAHPCNCPACTLGLDLTHVV